MIPNQTQNQNQKPICDQTVADSEGPYYEEGAPFRTDLVEDGMPGTRLRVSGKVLTADCEPIANALLDLWHCDSVGNYDNEGWTLRGRLNADGDGRFAFSTIVPGYWASRPRHIHIRVSARGFQLVTTQLYFAIDPENNNAGTARAALNLELTTGPDGVEQTAFNFYLEAE